MFYVSYSSFFGKNKTNSPKVITFEELNPEKLQLLGIRRKKFSTKKRVIFYFK